MSKLKYLFRIASGMRYKNMKRCIDYIHDEYGKNRLVTFVDMVWCMFRYGAGYRDYTTFAFHTMNGRQRKTYITRVKNKTLISRLNDQEKSYIFENKGEFRKVFKDYLGREVLDVKDLSFDEFSEFMKEKEIIFAKPYKGESGHGIERLSKSDFKSLEAMYEYVTDGKFGLIEELIVQHDDINRIYPLALNTYRISTVVAGGKAYCVQVFAKFGTGGNCVDNLGNGGVCCPVDMQTGEICGDAHSDTLKHYSEHPDTHIKLVGYKMPYVKEAVELCKKAALEVEGMRYIGWDVFVSPNGPGIVEGNDYPCYEYGQFPEHNPQRIGLIPKLEEILGEKI